MAEGMDELRRRILAELEARRLSPRRVSIAIGASENVVNRLLSGAIKQPSSGTVMALAKHFGWPVDETLALAGHRLGGNGAELLDEDALAELRRSLARVRAWPPEASRSLVTLATLLYECFQYERLDRTRWQAARRQVEELEEIASADASPQLLVGTVLDCLEQALFPGQVR